MDGGRQSFRSHLGWRYLLHSVMQLRYHVAARPNRAGNRTAEAERQFEQLASMIVSRNLSITSTHISRQPNVFAAIAQQSDSHRHRLAPPFCVVGYARWL